MGTYLFHNAHSHIKYTIIINGCNTFFTNSKCVLIIAKRYFNFPN